MSFFQRKKFTKIDTKNYNLRVFTDFYHLLSLVDARLFILQ